MTFLLGAISGTTLALTLHLLRKPILEYLSTPKIQVDSLTKEEAAKYLLGQEVSFRYSPVVVEVPQAQILPLRKQR